MIHEDGKKYFDIAMILIDKLKNCVLETLEKELTKEELDSRHSFNICCNASTNFLAAMVDSMIEKEFVEEKKVLLKSLCEHAIELIDAKDKERKEKNTS
jgi:hypothetical protein